VTVIGDAPPLSCRGHPQTLSVPLLRLSLRQDRLPALTQKGEASARSIRREDVLFLVALAYCVPAKRFCRGSGQCWRGSDYCTRPSKPWRATSFPEKETPAICESGYAVETLEAALGVFYGAEEFREVIL